MKLSKIEKAEIKDLIRQLVVVRDNERCLKCSTTVGLQMSHIYSVGAYKKLEFDEDNIIILCVKHHLYWWHKEIMDAKEWLELVLPKERLQRLKLRAISNTRNPIDYKLLKLYFQTEIKRYELENKNNLNSRGR